MIIVAVLYAVVVWLFFFKFKLLPWNWLTGTVTVLVGVSAMEISALPSSWECRADSLRESFGRWRASSGPAGERRRLH
jgi:hypothetical protein